MIPSLTTKATLSQEESGVFIDCIAETVSLFQRTEQVLKLCERNTLESNIPAINELRYAGCHLTKALSDNTSYDEKINDLIKARAHCKRGFYDAIEGTILYFLEDIRVFTYDYRNVEISDLIPEYFIKLKEIEDIRKTSQRIATNKEKEDLYESLYARINYLQTITEEFQVLRPEINKRMKKDRTAKRISIAGATGGVATLIFYACKFIKYLFT